MSADPLKQLSRGGIADEVSMAAKKVSASTTMLIGGAALGAVPRLVGHELGGDREYGVGERGGGPRGTPFPVSRPATRARPGPDPPAGSGVPQWFVVQWAWARPPSCLVTPAKKPLVFLNIALVPVRLLSGRSQVRVLPGAPGQQIPGLSPASRHRR
jgi:hypothetical protein